MKQLLEEITAGFDDLPPQLKEAARWVIDHPADVALLSMREQARRAGIAAGDADAARPAVSA